MGPSEDQIKQVQFDAHKATLRHFRDDAEDNGYQPAISFDETDQLVRDQLAKGADLPVQENAVAPSDVPAGPNTDPSDVPATQAAEAAPKAAPKKAAPKAEEASEA